MPCAGRLVATIAPRSQVVTRRCRQSPGESMDCCLGEVVHMYASPARVGRSRTALTRRCKGMRVMQMMPSNGTDPSGHDFDQVIKQAKATRAKFFSENRG